MGIQRFPSQAQATKITKLTLIYYCLCRHNAPDLYKSGRNVKCGYFDAGIRGGMVSLAII